MKKSKFLAFLLCLVGGFVGLHRFYTGSRILGIFYLCTLGGCGCLWALDLARFTILSGAEIWQLTPLGLIKWPYKCGDGCYFE